jgi:rhodanese-related sulfurtransferase/DNA-binding transcriptional ArsR family regulator
MSRPSSLSAKLTLFGAFAGVARALGNPHRLDLLEHLAQGEKCVEGLAAKAGLSMANTSQHLQALRAAGLVIGDRKGKQVVYRLAGDDVLDVLAALQAVSERHAGAARRVVGDYFHARDTLEPVTFDALRQRLSDGVVTLIDVRPPDEFEAGHVPGALNIPLADLEARLTELPPAPEVVAYCRGPWCVLAFEAVAFLRSKGRAARRLDGGLPEWRRAGLAVETGAAS